ncbi:MAG: TonB C-terminal domain-containing protein [Acidobacteriia bacterium]|nr:TonB C-terminal domain-containing protein [Terriglobia bacterium]
MMAPHIDILEQPERLRGCFLGSLALHALVFASIVGFTWAKARAPRFSFGNPNGGGFGSVAVNVVPRIPLPTDSGPVNPVANDTQSRAPEPPPKPKAQPRAKAPDLDSIPLPSRSAPRRTAEAASPPNKWRQQQQELPNQVYSQSGQRLVSPMIGITGGGGVGIGDNSPFGTQFGYYATLIKNQVGSHWRTTDIPPQYRTAPQPAIVTFTIRRDGSVPANSVRLAQTSGIPALDMSAQRAVLEAQPFPPLPQQFPRDSADVEFKFELTRR